MLLLHIYSLIETTNNLQIEKSIKEWITGTRNSITFSPDTHRARFEYYRGELKRYRDHKAIQEEHIFSDYVIALERAARCAHMLQFLRVLTQLSASRKNLKQSANKMKREMRFDGETSSEEEKPATRGIDEDDILRSLRKRKPAVPKPMDAGALDRDAGNGKGKELNLPVADPSASGAGAGATHGHGIGLRAGGFVPVGFAGVSQSVPGNTCE